MSFLCLKLYSSKCYKILEELHQLFFCLIITIIIIGWKINFFSICLSASLQPWDSSLHPTNPFSPWSCDLSTKYPLFEPHQTDSSYLHWWNCHSLPIRTECSRCHWNGKGSVQGVHSSCAHEQYLLLYCGWNQEQVSF